MLFLFNATMFDLGDPKAFVAAARPPIPPAAVSDLTMAGVVALIREAVFERPDIERAAPQKAATLCALAALKSEADAVRAIRRPDAEGPGDVQVRFASTGLILATQLLMFQDSGTLTQSNVDTLVWSVADA